VSAGSVAAMSDAATVPEVSADELAERIAAGPVAMVDVRNLDEWLDRRVPGVPLIPLGDLPDHLDDLPVPPEGAPLHVICRSGARSARAVAFLRALDIDAVNVAGGTLAWVEGGHPVTSGPG
jgi:rhodanese-related sulfurtransferase